jgi:DMSO/TMAO reductase YedYZ molybdopterin-dependent catalytic subunit
MQMTRRQLLLTSAAGLLPVTAGSAEQAARKLITLSPRPTDLEMPVEGFVDEITPTEDFFVRCHTYTPQVKLADWKLTLDGLVEKPMTFTLPDLQKLPRTELVSVLECAGNGRSFYEPHIPGAQWKFGAVGNARWAGVRLRDVLQKAGVKPGAAHLLLDGADVPLGKMPDFQRTLEVGKAMHPDTLLAWEMNGQPLTPDHGFPLRVIAPGWAGDSWVKWLQHIEVLDHEFDGFWMKTAYRHPSHSVAPGSTVDAKDLVPVTDLNVKSVIAVPGDWAKPGLVAVQGVAWSNGAAVSKVEVSVDAGKSWKAAKLTGTPTKYGFRKWSFAWQAAEGRHTLISRATDSSGRTQPMQQEWNPSGYLWNVAQPRGILVAAKPEADIAVDVTTANVPDAYKTACNGCHDSHMMMQQRLTRAQWEKEIDKMTGWGASVKPDDRTAIVDYLAGQFKP